MSAAALDRRRLIVITGKGGVGKSVTAMVIAQCLGRRGRHVRLIEIDPRQNLHELAGISPSAGEIARVGPHVTLQHVDPRRVIEQIVRAHLRIQLLARRVVTSPVFEHFVATAPGLKEVAVLGYAYRLIHGLERDGPPVDTVILDAPATGHGLALLTAPSLVAGVISEGPFARMARELADWIGREDTAIAVVTLAEEMPAQEALELAAATTDRLGRPADLLVVNALYPPVTGKAVGTLGELWRRRRAMNERESSRLDRAWRGARVDLPLVAEPRGPGLVHALAPPFERALEADGVRNLGA